jgi:hypothetical protein
MAVVEVLTAADLPEAASAAAAIMAAASPADTDAHPDMAAARTASKDLMARTACARAPMACARAPMACVLVPPPWAAPTGPGRQKDAASAMPRPAGMDLNGLPVRVEPDRVVHPGPVQASVERPWDAPE